MMTFQRNTLKIKNDNLRNYDEYLKEAADYLDEICFKNLSGKQQGNDSISHYHDRSWNGYRGKSWRKGIW